MRPRRLSPCRCLRCPFPRLSEPAAATIPCRLIASPASPDTFSCLRLSCFAYVKCSSSSRAGG